MSSHAAHVDRAFDRLADLVGDGSQPYDRELAAEYAATFWDAVAARDAAGDHSLVKRPSREDVEAVADLPTTEIMALYGVREHHTVHAWFEHYGIEHRAKGQRTKRAA